MKITKIESALLQLPLEQPVVAAISSGGRGAPVQTISMLEMV